MIQLFGTLGPACAERETLRRMFAVGMDGMRINLSHVRLFGCERWLERLFAAAAEEGVAPKLIIDMQGPELRIGCLPQPLRLTDGEEVLLGDSGVPVPDAVLSVLCAGDSILLDDGRILLEAAEATERFARCKTLRGGVLQSRKSLAIPGKEVLLPPLTEADTENLFAAKDFGVTGVMQPFVRGERDLAALRAALAKAGLSHARVYAKVENRQGLDALQELIDGADELVVARGDLANSVTLYALPGVQKRIAKACNRAGRPFMVATELLYSMTERPVPTRAEVSDIFNAVLDGASSLIVTNETAAGRYPAEVIGVLRKTADAACSYRANSAQ